MLQWGLIGLTTSEFLSTAKLSGHKQSDRTIYEISFSLFERNEAEHDFFIPFICELRC